jgi:SHS2 domain-containing protein
MNDRDYSIGDHPSDLELNVSGRTLPDLFSEAARAVIDYIGAPPAAGPARRRSVDLSAADRDELLVVWLNEIIYLLEIGFLPALPVRINRLTDRELQASLEGGKLDPQIPFSGPEIKAATYHQLSIRKTDNRWTARVILDL